jgi:proline iminopeptidase
MTERQISARDRFVAFRRTQPRAPRLEHQSVDVRGLPFAVYSTPPVQGALPLLCVNGGLLFDHGILWPALAPLSAKRQLILYDQRGRGETPPPTRPEDTRIEDDARDVGALRKALGIGRWDVLGHSWGGGIALLGAEQDQEGTGRLVLVDAVGATSAWMKEMQPRALERLDPGGRAMLQRYDDWTLGKSDPAVQSAYSRALYPAWFADSDFAKMFAPPRSESVAGAAVAARLRREGYDWRSLARAFKRPAIVIHGMADLLPVAVAEELVSLLPNATLATIPGAGHMPFWEAPERFFDLVNSFLAEPA